MESLVVLLVIWLVVVPIVALLVANRAGRRSEQLEDQVRALQARMTRVEIERERERPAAAAAAAGPAAFVESPVQSPVSPVRETQQAAGSAAEPVPSPMAEAAHVVEAAPPVPTPPAAAGLAGFVPKPKPEPGLWERWGKKLGRGEGISWEQFMGARLFAWLGGLALFLAVAFFVKYSFENNLAPPELRVVMGFAAGLGLLVGGVALKRKAYVVTAHTLCGTGVVILYAVSFACNTPYGFTGEKLTFLLMVAVTVTAFLLAVRLEALVVAVLGLVGGFLTPPLLSTGVDNPLGLFGYIAILDIGLVAVAAKRRWSFLVVLGALGTLAMQIGWAAEFFKVEKEWIALAVLGGFNLLFLAAFAWQERRRESSRWVTGAAAALPVATFVFSLWLLGFRELGGRPMVIFSFLLAADLPLLAMVLLRTDLRPLQLAGGGASFLVLGAWTTAYLVQDLLGYALGAYFVFAALHTYFPVVLQRLRPGAGPVWWGQLFAPLALLLVLAPLVKGLTAAWAFWVVVLALDALVVGLALLIGGVAAILAALVLTVVAMGTWIVHVPVDVVNVMPILAVVGFFALVFFGVGLLGARRYAVGQGSGIPAWGTELPAWLSQEGGSAAAVSGLSAILPFLLLIMAAGRLRSPDPSGIYGLGLVLILLLLGLARHLRLGILPAIGLASIVALEYAWHGRNFRPEEALGPLLWHAGFAAVFMVYPFVCGGRFLGQVVPWATAALAGPATFHLVYREVFMAYPNNVMGLLPAVFALPMVAGLAFLARRLAADAPNRLALLAWFGGSALFFVTLIFPVQWDKQWITVGWALEGMALLWLFHRIPHRGLQALGVVLLAVAFVRLALNPAVLDYHPRSEVRIWNWYLYSYGLVTVALLVGARLLAPPRQRVFQIHGQALLYALGTILAFLLVNIEIADYFAEGSTLTFQFSGGFGRDMTYSIAWALFALALLVIGVWKRQQAVRYASMALLAVTLLKLFLHDLVHLSALYRIGAFVGVAIISILASTLYQRFFAAAERAPSKAPIFNPSL